MVSRVGFLYLCEYSRLFFHVVTMLAFCVFAAFAVSFSVLGECNAGFLISQCCYSVLHEYWRHFSKVHGFCLLLPAVAWGGCDLCRK